MGYLVFCNTDGDGNITDGFTGINIIPDRQYEHFFFLDEEVELSDCKISYATGKPKLVEKEVEE